MLLVLVLLNLPSQTATQLKLALGGLFLPLFGLASSAQNLTERAGNTVVPRRVLLEQIKQLQQTNQQLRVQAMQQPEVWRENQQLRQSLGWQKSSPWQLKLARVVGRDPANWWRTIQIDVGSRDGVHTNCPVLTNEGLVGRVAGVGLTRSQVLLLGDPNCRVAAVIEKTRDKGIITPGSSSSWDHLLVDLTFLPGNVELKAGLEVSTSGEGGVFPRGIPVGRILDTITKNYGLYAEARVKLNADLNRLEEVWVMFP